MCDVCGLTWCHSMCPNYSAEEDPSVRGFCENCGAPLYGDPFPALCPECKEELKTMPIIEFDAATHTYIVDDERVPCVSDIIAVYGVDVDEGDDLELLMDAAAERGTVLHAVIASYLRGETEVEYPSAYEPYVDGIRLFLSEHRIEPLSIETPVFCEKYGIAGTPDLLCEFDGRLAVIDYKFVSQIAKTKVKAQLNAYDMAYEEMGVYPEERLAIQFLKDGTYRVYPVAYGEDELEAAFKVYMYKHKRHRRGEIS